MIKYNSEEIFTVKRGYVNRTKIYLYPAIVTLASYPQIRNVKDNFLCCAYKEDSIILFYDRKNTLGLHTLVETLKQNGEFIDSFLHNEDTYCIVVSPNLNYAAFEEGSYTDIYSEELLKRSFTKDSKTRQVLTKDPSYKQTFVDLLNEWFNTKHTIDFLESRPDGNRIEIQQYDIPPCMNQETVAYERQTTKSIGNGFVKATHSQSY